MSLTYGNFVQTLFAIKMPPRESSSSSNDKSSKDKKRKRQLNRLEAASTFLDYLEQVAKQTPIIPGFGLAVTSARLIVNIVKVGHSSLLL